VKATETAEGLFAEHEALGRLAGNARPLGEHDDQTVGIVGGDTMESANWNENDTALLNRNIVAVFEGYRPGALDDIENFVLHGVLMQHRKLPWCITDDFAYRTFGLNEFLANPVFLGKLNEIGNFMKFDVFG
jgi:hypothetical protein|tara:strand:+ start:896 stop:1291 length:396 start_codon:yes stop_codon:yes gene_type:complete